MLVLMESELWPRLVECGWRDSGDRGECAGERPVICAEDEAAADGGGRFWRGFLWLAQSEEDLAELLSRWVHRQGGYWCGEPEV